MNSKLLIIVFVLTFVGCSSSHKRVKYKSGAIKIKMKIPPDFKFEGLAGDYEWEKRYWYPDSSVIYISTFTNTMNYDEIRKQGTYYDRFFALHRGDTITLSGIDKNNLYWKDILLENGVTIGYSKVPEKRLVEFERAINSVKIKYSNCLARKIVRMFSPYKPVFYPER